MKTVYELLITTVTPNLVTTLRNKSEILGMVTEWAKSKNEIGLNFSVKSVQVSDEEYEKIEIVF